MLFMLILIIATSLSATAGFQPSSFGVVGRVGKLPLLRETTVPSYANESINDLKTRVSLTEEREKTTTATLLRIETSLDKKFDSMDKKFDRKFDSLDKKFDKKFDDMDKKFDKKFDSIDKKFDDMDKKFDKKFDIVDKKFDIVDKKFDIVDKKLDSMDKKMTTNFTGLYVLLTFFATATGMANFKDFVAIFK